MIKMIATDLDGTLLYPKKKILLINKLNKKFLSQYTKDGYHLVLVSGRNISIAKRMKRKFQSRVDMIGCNGAIIYLNDKIFSEKPLDKDKITKLYEDNLLNENIGQWIFMTNHHNMIIVPNGMNTIIKICYRIGMMFQFRYHGAFKFGRRFLKKELAKEDTKIYKAMAIYGLGKKACARAKIAYDDFVEKKSDEFEIMWSNESIEFMQKGVNKASAINSIIDQYGINDKEIAVVGDSGNDIPMFETFPNSFVMSHSDKEIQKKAKYVISGVYDLEKYINMDENNQPKE